MNDINNAKRIIFLDIDGVLQPGWNEDRFKHDLEQTRRDMAEKFNDEAYLKLADVQILLLLLETLDVLLGRKKMNKNNILMSDCETWGDFMQIRSWEQLRNYLN